MNTDTFTLSQSAKINHGLAIGDRVKTKYRIAIRNTLGRTIKTKYVRYRISDFALGANGQLIAKGGRDGRYGYLCSHIEKLSSEYEKQNTMPHHQKH